MNRLPVVPSLSNPAFWTGATLPTAVRLAEARMAADVDMFHAYATAHPDWSYPVCLDAWIMTRAWFRARLNDEPDTDRPAAKPSEETL